jgi:predicted PurR-regulated permease PerM
MQVAPASEERTPSFSTFIILATCVLVVACLYLAQSILIPLALSLLLTFLLAPAVNLGQRLGLPRAAAVLVSVTIAGLVVASIGWVVVTQFTTLATDLRRNATYRQHITEKLEDLQTVGKGGAIADLQATVQEILSRLEPASSSEHPRAKPRVVVQDDASPLTTLQTTLAPLLEPLGAAVLVVVFVVFMLLEHEDLRNRLIALVGARDLTRTTRALEDAGQRISRYLLMQFIINSSYGLALGAGLFLLGVPYAVLWGFLAAVLRYVPYIGPWIAAIFPLTISLVAFSGWAPLLWVIALFVILELGSNMIMEPWLYGQSVGVSQVGLLAVTGFWTWLWGPIGLVLATPLTVCIVVLGRYVPQLYFFDVLVSDRAALTPPTVFYQRLLARDQDEAQDLVHDYQQEHAVNEVYDDIIAPALLLAWQDRRQGTLESQDRTFILRATEEIIEEARTNSLEATTTDETSPASIPQTNDAQVIFGCPAHDESEQLFVQMVGALLHQQGQRVEALTTHDHVTELLVRIKQTPPAVIFIAVLPGGLPQARHLCRAVRREYPLLPIVVGYWGEKETFDRTLTEFRQAGATALTTSIQQSFSRILTLTTEEPMPAAAQVVPVTQAAS